MRAFLFLFVFEGISKVEKVQTFYCLRATMQNISCFAHCQTLLLIFARRRPQRNRNSILSLIIIWTMSARSAKRLPFSILISSLQPWKQFQSIAEVFMTPGLWKRTSASEVIGISGIARLQGLAPGARPWARAQLTSWDLALPHLCRMKNIVWRQWLYLSGWVTFVLSILTKEQREKWVSKRLRTETGWEQYSGA